MSNPDCPYCGTEMKYGGEEIYEGFPDEDDSPRTRWYYCDSGLNIMCHGGYK